VSAWALPQQMPSCANTLRQNRKDERFDRLEKLIDEMKANQSNNEQKQ